MSISRTDDGSFVRNEDEKKGNFRFFQPYTDSAVWKRIKRDPGVAFFTRELTIKSLKNINVIDKDGKIHKDNKRIQDAIRPFNSERWNAIQSDLAFGYGMLSFNHTKSSNNENGEEEDKSKTFKFTSFWKNQITFKHDKNGIINYLKGSKVIKHPDDDVSEPKIVHEFGKGTTAEKTNREINLKFSKFIGSIPGVNIGEYEEWLRVIWDDLYGWNVISSSAILFAIRNGAGQWVVYAKPSFIKENKGMMKEQVKGTSAEDSFIALPLFTDSDGKQVELTSLSGDQIDFKALKEIPLGRISMQTGVPKSRIEGITQGQQAGEVFIDKELSEAKQMRQDKFKHVDQWMVERVAEHMDITLGDGWDVEYDKREELSTRGDAEVTSLKLKNFEIMRKYMPLKTAASQSGLEWEDIPLTEPEPLDLEGDGDDTDSDDDKPDGLDDDDTEEGLLDEDT